MTATRLSIRVTKEELVSLEAASERARISISEYIHRKALDAIEGEVSERRMAAIPSKKWEAFEAWAARPPAEIPALKELSSKTPAWLETD